MSGTYESAQQAAQGASLPVTVVDGKNNSMGLGWQVIAAARVREAGGDLNAMWRQRSRSVKELVYFVTLDTIEYLARVDASAMPPSSSNR